jgi:hypothetical protein
MKKLRDWALPLVFLSTNWISLIGAGLVTTSVIFWLFLLPSTWEGESVHPYLGILTFLILPVGFFTGLCTIPVGVMLRLRKDRKQGKLPDQLPPLDWKHGPLRRLVVFLLATTFANVMLASQFTYRAVTYMDSVGFCGQACHTVMKPEFTAYQASSHSRVECVKCHIGPGAGWFVRSKLSGLRQVVAVTLNTHPRPIPTPIEDLRPARDTCEACHWPQKFGADRLRITDKFAEDETNTHTRNVLLMRIGGGARRPGIHGAHLGEGVVIRYRAIDEKRQTIPWVEYTRNGGERRLYLATDTKPETVEGLSTRVMDCMDCHNRPSHSFESAETALDLAMASGRISPKLPFAKKHGLELLKAPYASGEEAERRIPERWRQFYEKEHPQAFAAQRAEIDRAGQALVTIFNRNVFPEMKVTWGTYPNNVGHNDFPGCFRCHDERQAQGGTKTVTQDCNNCHQVLAMDESDPKILNDLGIAP